MRRAFGSALDAFGLVGIAAPVPGSTRMMVPLSPTGFPARSCAGSAPPSASGTSSNPATANRRVAARIPALAVVHELEACPVAAARVQGAVGTEAQIAERMAGELLKPVVDEHTFRSSHDIAGGLQPRQSARHFATVCRRARWIRTRIAGLSRTTPTRRRAADRTVVGVENVDVRTFRKAWIEFE